MSVLVFDFDSTLVSVEGLDELFSHSLEGAADRKERVVAFGEVTDLGMAGEITAEDSLNRRLTVLRADRSMVRRVGEEISERLSPSVERNRDFFTQNADRIYVLSGGFEELILPTLGRLGLPPHRLLAHRFRYDAEGRVIGLDPRTPIARGGKPEALRTLGVGEGPLWMIGDGATDLEVRLLGLVDQFVAFTENRYREAVVEQADLVVRSMEELLEIDIA